MYDRMPDMLAVMQDNMHVMFELATITCPRAFIVFPTKHGGLPDIKDIKECSEAFKKAWEGMLQTFPCPHNLT